MIRPYYRGSAGILLVYDVTDARSFDNVQDWMTNIEENTSEYQVVQKVLVGNKTDMEKSEHVVPRQAYNIHVCAYMYVYCIVALATQTSYAYAYANGSTHMQRNSL
jgi:GTPase SAR1 family protein